MIPNIIESLSFHVDDWYYVPLDDVAVFQNEHGVDPERSIHITKDGVESYTVTLDTEYATVESEDLDVVTACATVLGFMQNPALFEQYELE